MTRDRIRFITAHYDQLQGLRLIPLGVYLLALAASGLGWLSWLPGDPARASARWLGALFCVALAAAVAATAWYRRRYGARAPLSRRRRNAWLVLAVGIFVVAAQFDQYANGPVALAPLSVAAALMLTVRADGWVRAHFLLAAVPWFVVGWVPALHHDGTSRLVSYALAGGVALIVCGIGDHRLLSQTLIDPPDVAHGPHSRLL
jgi:hypothetical protein